MRVFLDFPSPRSGIAWAIFYLPPNEILVTVIHALIIFSSALESRTCRASGCLSGTASLSFWLTVSPEFKATPIKYFPVERLLWLPVCFILSLTFPCSLTLFLSEDGTLNLEELLSHLIKSQLSSASESKVFIFSLNGDREWHIFGLLWKKKNSEGLFRVNTMKAQWKGLISNAFVPCMLNLDTTEKDQITGC